MGLNFYKSGLFIFIISGLLISCGTTRRSPQTREGELINSRRYIGNYIDYSRTGPETLGGPDLIWIKTSLYNDFGKISAYGKKCEFTPGERLYLKRLYSTPGAYGQWEYQVEDDSSRCYRVSEFRYENNVLVRASF